MLENVKGELAQMIRAEEERQRQIAAQQAAIAQARQAAAAAAARARAEDGRRRGPGLGRRGAGRRHRAAARAADGNAAAVAVAMQQLGTPYVWGGAGPGGLRLQRPRLLRLRPDRQERAPLHRRDLEPVPQGRQRRTSQAGDMVFFNGGGHMGIYIGGGQYVHAPQTGDVVKVSNLGERSDYMGAVRP